MNLRNELREWGKAFRELWQEETERTKKHPHRMIWVYICIVGLLLLALLRRYGF